MPALPTASRLAPLLLLGLAGLALQAGAVAPEQMPPPVQQVRPMAPRLAQAPAARPAVPAPTRPAWNELTPPQQQALAPLAAGWNTISEAQKRKWLALSQNYPRMPAEEQAKLHSRMAEWVALSPQQRTQARLNFAETKELSPDDKKAKWEAYQALPPEEKRKLAGAAASRPTPATAAAVKPIPAQKLATVPKPNRDAKSPRIAAGPVPGALPAAGPQPAVPGAQAN